MTTITVPRALIEEGLKRVVLALEEPNNTMSDGKALREVVRQLQIAAKALTAALAQSEPQGWRPIETAPKDGTRVLLVIDHDVHGDKVWTGLWADGWIVSYGKTMNKPTHWMQLPTPPENSNAN